MRPDAPEKTCKVAPAEQQPEQRAGTPEEKAALLAELTAEAASLKQHVLGMQSLVPLTPDNSEPSLSRSQASFTTSGACIPDLTSPGLTTNPKEGARWCNVVTRTEDESEGRHTFAGMQVAQHLLGCSQSLQTVTRHVINIYSENGQDEDLTETAVRNMIIDLAARKSFAAKDSESSASTARSSNYTIAGCNLIGEVCHHAEFLSSLLSKAEE